MRLLLPLALLVAAVQVAASPVPRTLDDFETEAGWAVSSSDGVSAGLSVVPGASGRALRLEYDFTKGSGYAVLRRELPLDLGGNFALRFRLRGEGAANALELKLVDSTGENVWWHRKPEYVPLRDWTAIRVKRRMIEFAWGPTADKTLRRTAAIEFVVAAGSGGGKGWIAVDDLTLEPLPPDPAVPPPVKASGGTGAAKAVDGNPASLWQAAPGEAVDLDLGYSREFGGLMLQWGPNAHASDYQVQFSADRRAWRTVRTVTGGNGGTDWIKLEESEARHVRLRPLRGPAGRFALAEVEVRPVDFGASDNAFVAAVAEAEKRGAFPRGFIGEQNYWTLVATPDGGNSGLIDESGAIEVGRGGFSVEPFVLDGDKLLSWADVRPRQSLLERIYPVPSVHWSADGWSLKTTAYAVTVGGAKQLVGEYTLANAASARGPVALVLAVRPFQVNPQQQFLNITGGVSRIERLRWGADGLYVNGARALVPLVEPEREIASSFDSGMLPQALAAAGGAEAIDPTGLASGAMVFAKVPPGERVTYRWVAPLDDKPIARQVPPPVGAARQEWAAALGDMRLLGPAAAAPIFETLPTALAHILATREGPALRPGSRAYARSWIRDGAMMSTALLRMGLADPAERYLLWYAPFQYANGKVPCCVDKRGADPVPEHDSDGELIHLVAQLERYAPDTARSERLWPRVRAAADHIEALRRKTMTVENRVAGRRHFYGLLPPSISHEGYSAKPMHSYWDDFWALAGLKDAAWLAERLGKGEQASELRARADAFRADILASIEAAGAVHRIDFIPGAADLGDFDATSTTIALSVAGEHHRLPQDRLVATFERYWAEFVARRDGHKAWDAYTPYEWRNVGAFTRLGWRERTQALVRFFMGDRRPATWHQWAEVVGRVPREPRFIGDMPHGWVASDFINAALDMLAYERERDGALVLAAGVPAEWLADGGITVERLRTPYGLLSYNLAADGPRARLRYRLDGLPPPGGLVLGWPTPAGAPADWTRDGLRLKGRSGVVEFGSR